MTGTTTPGRGESAVMDSQPPRPGTNTSWDLVQQVQAGDRDAYGQIYELYVDRVFRFIYQRVGNRQLAEDLTSDTFLRALRRIDSFTWQGRDIGSWLLTIARNLVVDHFKSITYRQEILREELPERRDEDRAGDPQAAALASLDRAAINLALAELIPEHRRVLALRFLEQMSIPEVAEVLGITTTTAVKALQYRALANLRRVYRRVGS